MALDGSVEAPITAKLTRPSARQNAPRDCGAGDKRRGTATRARTMPRLEYSERKRSQEIEEIVNAALAVEEKVIDDQTKATTATAATPP